MAVPAGGTNGANGFALVDEDAAVIGGWWIVPLLPLPCGNGSNAWLGCGIAMLDVDVTIVVGSIAVDVIEVDMILSDQMFSETARHAMPENDSRENSCETLPTRYCTAVPS